MIPLSVILNPYVLIGRMTPAEAEKVAPLLSGKDIPSSVAELDAQVKAALAMVRNPQ